jgi:hypothetical protein
MAAKERVKLKQQQKLCQITTSVDDPSKSISELINAGIRTHEQQQRGKHFERNKNKAVSCSS